MDKKDWDNFGDEEEFSEDDFSARDEDFAEPEEEEQDKKDFSEEESLDRAEEEPELSEETKEKFDDVDDILEDKPKKANKKAAKASLKTKAKKEEGVKTEETEKTQTEKKDNFSWDEEEPSSSNTTWKIISGVLLVLLVAAIFTHGFQFTGAASASLTKIEAEEKALDYVNKNLLRPPYTAEAKATEEVDNLYQITLEVAGQEVEAYLTKDGKFFFPQGFDLTAAPETSLTESGAAEAEAVKVSIEGEPLLGNKDAPVILVEFSDFQCPFCKKGWEVIKQIEKEYVEAGKVKIAFRDFPLDFHPLAQPAALAAQCAFEQNKFWEYHDQLFQNQDALSQENFKKWAEELGLDTSKFKDCLETKKYQKEVEKDLKEGQDYGVSGTPAFFVNGKLITGAQPYSVFKQAIEEALKEPAGEETKEKLEESEEKTETQIEKPREENTAPAEEEPSAPVPQTREFSLKAKKWRFDPKYLEANSGDKVKLTITSDFDLNFVLPDFNLDAEILAGQTKTLEFTADKAGTFEFSCGTYCYKKYGEIQGSALNGELVIK